MYKCQGHRYRAITELALCGAIWLMSYVQDEQILLMRTLLSRTGVLFSSMIARRPSVPTDAATLAKADEGVGMASKDTRSVIEVLLAHLAPEIVELLRDPNAAMLTLPALLLQPGEYRNLVHRISDGKLSDPIESLWASVEGMDSEERFALLDFVEQAIKPRDKRLVEILEEIAVAAPANAWELQFWITLLINTACGGQRKSRVKYKHLRRHLRETMEVISIGVSMGRIGLANVRFQNVWSKTSFDKAKVMKIDAFDFIDLEESVETLRMMPLQLRTLLVDALIDTMAGKDNLDVPEATFLRYICRRWGVAPKIALTPGAPQSA